MTATDRADLREKVRVAYSADQVLPAPSEAYSMTSALLSKGISHPNSNRVRARAAAFPFQLSTTRWATSPPW